MIENLILSASEDKLNGKCLYRLDDFTLIYEYQCRDNIENTPNIFQDRLEMSVSIHGHTPLFLIMDTLTLSFDRNRRSLMEIDAYTNYNSWENCKWDSPPVTKGWRTLTLDGTELIDHKGIPVMPRYEGDIVKGFVRVFLDGTNSSKYYDIGKDLILGVKENQIKEIVFCNLQVI